MTFHLWFLAVLTTAFDLQKTSEIPMAQPVDSVAWLGFEGILTWREGGSVVVCVLRGEQCTGKQLTVGSESVAFACKACQVVQVAVTNDTAITVFQLDADGEVDSFVSIPAQRPVDVTGLFLDEVRSLVVWSALSRSQDYDIFACLLSSGTKQDCGFMVNSFAQGDQRHPTVTTTQEGAIITWVSTGFRFGIFGQRLSTSGKKLQSEFGVVDGIQYHSPVLIPGPVLVVSKQNGVDSMVTTLVFSVPVTQAAVRMWVLNEFDSRGRNVSGATIGSELYLLRTFVDFEGRSRVEIKKTNLSGCVQSQYQTSKDPLHSHSHGVILEVATDHLAVMFFDEVKKALIVQVLSNPANSVCAFPSPPLFPQWTKPVPVRPDPWKKITAVSLFCFSFVLFVLLVVCAVKLVLRRWKTLREAASNFSLDQSHIIIKGDNSMSVFEVHIPSSPSSPEQLIRVSQPESPGAPQD